ncbi:MAG: CPBP family intramembrane glutamic endopeptidase [Candidatus Dormibacteria bacterium]
MGAVLTLRSRPWWPSLVALLVVSAALAATLLVPRLFSDPVGLDPYVLRLSAVAVILAAATLVSERLRPVRAVLVTVAAMAVSFSVFAAGPQWIVDLSGDRFDGNMQQLLASIAETVVTAGAVVAVLRLTPAWQRPALRLRTMGGRGWLATALGLAIFFGTSLLLPATLLGRNGLAPIALARDLPLQVPACALQAFTQELQFRGLLMGSLERVATPAASNAAQAGLFGLAHIAVQYAGPQPVFVPVTMALGLLLGWITQRTRSLWPAIIIHGVADLAATVVVFGGLYGY